jgi:hypothetical protein
MSTKNPTAVSYSAQFANQTLPIIAFGNALRALRKRMGIVKWCANKDFAGINATKGSQCPIPYVGRIATESITPGPTASAATDLANNTRYLLLDNWTKSKPFTITDQEWSIFELGGVVPRALERAVQGLAEGIEEAVYDAIVYAFPAVTGTGGSSGAFASTINALASLRTSMSNNLYPMGDERALFLSTNDVGDMIILDDYKKNPQAAMIPQGQAQYTEALLGKLLGYNLFESHFIKTRTPGTYAGTATMASTAAIGSLSISITTSAGTWAMKKGDVLKLVNSSAPSGYHYVAVAADVSIASTTGTVTITQPLEWAAASGSAVATVASTTDASGYAPYENLCISPDAVAIGNRILVTGDLAEATGNVWHVTDDGDQGTGMTFTLKKFPGSYQAMYEASVFWGVTYTDTRLGGRLMSGGTALSS